MNLSENPGDSLYSGGQDGHGRTWASPHDCTLHPSTGLKHAAHFYQYLLHVAKENLSEDEYDMVDGLLPYVVLLETDGRPDHNCTFLYNILFIFRVFLVGNIDNL